MIATVTTIALAALVLSGILCLVRLRRGRSIPDRIVALDAFLLVGVNGVAVWTARTGDTAFLNALVVAALIAFIGTVTVARFVERRGAG